MSFHLKNEKNISETAVSAQKCGVFALHRNFDAFFDKDFSYAKLSITKRRLFHIPLHLLIK